MNIYRNRPHADIRQPSSEALGLNEPVPPDHTNGAVD